MGAEGLNGPESVEVTKDQVIEAYKKFVERGVTSPEGLDDPEFDAAKNLFYKWVEQGDAKVAGDSIARYEFNFEKTIFYVDIGFNDPEYLEEVLDFLDQDLENVELHQDNPRMVKLKEDIEAKVKSIKGQLGTLE